MDGPQFDRMARSWAIRTNRRGALQTLPAIILAGWGWLRPRSARAQPSSDLVPCSQDADCADADLDPCTGGACVDRLCTYFIVDCIPGHVCCGNGACCPTGEPSSCQADADCAPTSSDPCEGARCDGGTCVPFLAACALGFACCGNGACCPTDGGCVVDADCGALPSPWNAGTRCVSGVCAPSFASV